MLAGVAEKLICSVLGFVFLGVLAYAALRTQPITDSGQFWALRVVASVSAAACAALIPGFIRLRFKDWFRAGGAIAVFAVIWFFNPPAVLSRPDDGYAFAMLVLDPEAAAMLSPAQPDQFTYDIDGAEAPLPREGLVFGQTGIPAAAAAAYRQIVAEGFPHAVYHAGHRIHVIVRYKHSKHCEIEISTEEKRIWRVHLTALCD